MWEFEGGDDRERDARVWTDAGKMGIERERDGETRAGDGREVWIGHSARIERGHMHGPEGLQRGVSITGCV